MESRWGQIRGGNLSAADNDNDDFEDDNQSSEEMEPSENINSHRTAEMQPIQTDNMSSNELHQIIESQKREIKYLT